MLDNLLVFFYEFVTCCVRCNEYSLRVYTCTLDVDLGGNTVHTSVQSLVWPLTLMRFNDMHSI